MNQPFVAASLLAASALAQEPPLNDRFGLNASNGGEVAAQAGAGWIRFENLKWQMASPERGVYRWDGSVPPWGVNTDKLFSDAHARGVKILAYAFQTAHYAMPVPPDLRNAYQHPPTDFDAFAEFVFQAVARFGQTRHDPAVLKTADKKSGLGHLRALQIWNEPNLNNPDWGHWVGPLDDYFTLFKKAAAAAKKADPHLLILNGGFAGLSTRNFERMKNAGTLEWADALSAHFYCQPAPPEVEAVDTNVDRNPNARARRRTLERDLRRLVEWRDENAPGKPIWVTEFGWDTASGDGRVSEELQADYLVRAAVIMWANGVDKVFWFRESDARDPKIQYDSCGIVDGTGRRKASFAALQQLLRELGANFRFEKRLGEEMEKVRAYQFQTERGPMIIAWSTGEPQAVKLAGNSVQLSGKPQYLRAVASR